MGGDNIQYLYFNNINYYRFSLEQYIFHKMKKLKRELNVLSTNCKYNALAPDTLQLTLAIVVEDFESLIKMSSTNNKKSHKNSPL